MRRMVILWTYIFVIFSVLGLLPTFCTLEPNKCGEPTHVVIDIDEVNYTISFGVCEDESSPCSCSTVDKSLIITQAHLYADGSERDIQYKTETFDVVLPEPGMGVGTYHYSVSCEYDCISIVYHYCHGKSKETELIVEVVDFELVFHNSKPPVTEVSFYANEKEEDQKIMSGSYVTLSCSSGLNSSSNSSSLDLPVVFIFKGWNNDSITKSVECGQSHAKLNDGDWIVTRQDSPPYDCVLTIVNFGSEDVGKYSCYGLLPRDNSHYKAWSQTIIDLSIREQGSMDDGLIILAVVLTGVVLLLFLAIAVLVYRVKRNSPVSTPYTSLTGHRSLTQNYGATGSTGEISFVENTLVPSEGSVLNIDSELRADDSVNGTPPTVVVVPPSPSLQPLLLPQRDEDDPLINRESLEENTPKSEGPSSSGESEASRSRTSTTSTVESEGQEGIKYYGQHVDIDKPDGRDTPTNSDAPFDTNYTCKHCGKTYRQNQRLYYKRHIEHPEQRCPKFSQTKSDEDEKRLDIGIPPIGSTLGVPDITLPPTKDNRPQELEASGSDIDLHFLSESTGSSSKSGPPSTDLSGSSSGPPSSAGEEGRQIYDGVMDIQSAIGNTPKSQFPTDPNYKCRKCGKEYRCDQRLYLKRHLNEDRCISCCSDEQRNQPD